MQEVWVDIIGYNGKYKVSNTGKVISMNYNNTGKAKELKKKLNKNSGCYEVKLSKNNKTKDYMVGRLVAEHFIPNKLFKTKVIHKKDTTDDSVENLMWAYESEAMHNQYNKDARKQKSSFTKITFKGKKYKDYTSIAKDFGLNIKTFYSRLYNLNWNLYEELEIQKKRRKKDE